ncbi:hypothetical protein GMLC_00480 [Geomonas limicola]|uniref:DUF4154 domain-containing protein n=1 Tax=Geomonas limicola TaxID=2740186 RepID=A0A6V8N595_9BACT|nr:YfiR family protein [Geomonas limicola]GFO66469.1 hypothetical protein GMLC_00480 [Geomonas limicola]
MLKALTTYLALAALLVVCPAQRLSADSSPVTEQQVKAAYLYNFVKFVEWPASVLPAGTTPLTIALLGKGAGSEWLEGLSGRQVKGRRVVVRQITRVEECAGCQVIFIQPSERTRLKEILRGVPSTGVLTVSDIKNFCSLGGMIGLVTRNDKMQFEVNLGAAERAGLRLSSQMLKLALSIVE